MGDKEKELLKYMWTNYNKFVSDPHTYAIGREEVTNPDWLVMMIGEVKNSGKYPGLIDKYWELFQNYWDGHGGFKKLPPKMLSLLALCYRCVYYEFDESKDDMDWRKNGIDAALGSQLKLDAL